MDLAEVQKELLTLVKEGKAFATPRVDENGRVLFVGDVHATEADQEFTQVWLESPHFYVSVGG